MTRFAALCYAITAAAAAVGTTAFQPPPSLILPTLRHHEALVRFSSTHDSITTHNNHNDGQYQLEQKTWMFQDKYPIAYEVASADTTDSDKDEDVVKVPILLLNGFGVGSFHQHRLMRQLLIEQQNKQSNKRYVIYGIDYLGQGKSWPKDPQDGNSADEYQLGYSADMWLDQLASFVQEVVISPATDNDDSTTITTSNSIINNKVHLVGNSVGGYLATILTHKHPQLISSLTLLNATPVWGLNLPGWDGKLPAPAVPKAIGRQMFNLIRNEDIIRQYLEAAYVRGEAFDGTFEDGFDGWGCIASSNADDKNGAATAGRGEPLGAKIRACTEGNGGHAAFASILWSAPASGISFYEALQQVPVDVLLLFGGDDPWCTEAVGKRMHVTLASRRDGAACRFVTLKNVGHCPNHEAPTAVAQVLMPWLDADDSEERRVVPLDSLSQIQEPWGEVVIREVSIEESESLGLVDRVVSSMVG